MGKNRNNSEEIIEDQVEPPKEPKFISCKNFIKKLKSELKEIPERAYEAFISISPSVDTEENYWKVWNSTFKRK